MAEQIEQSYAQRYQALKSTLPGAGLGWLEELRDAAMARFLETGLPNQKVEAWKYTNLRSLRRTPFEPAIEALEAGDIDALPAPLPGAAARLVLVNGRCWLQGSKLENLPAGARLLPLADALAAAPALLEERFSELAKAGTPLSALNDAFLADGYVLILEDGAAVEGAIEILHLAQPGTEPLAAFPRAIIAAGAESRATVVERHFGPDGAAYFCNGVLAIDLAPEASLRHYRAQGEGDKAVHITTLRANIASGARLESFSLSLGGELARNDMAVNLNGDGAHITLDGAYLVDGRRICDNTTVIEHKSRGTTARETFKGVLDDNARAVFAGRIHVHPDAQGTDGHQLSKALLLSDKAEIATKPELEIYADDVKCGHGATAGELAEDALFYLRARGIPELRARHMLIEAFVGEAVDGISDDAVRAQFRADIAQWLATRFGA